MNEISSDRGRRPGNPQTREAILEAAITAFTAIGYAKTTIRAVAREAGVDPALVMHFFGTKDGLFDAAIRGGGLPVAQVIEVAQGDLATLGLRLATRYLSLWEDPEVGARLGAVLEAAASTPAARELLKEFMRETVLRPMAKAIGGADGETRALLAATQLVGVAMLRYVLRVEPLATMPPEQVVAMVTPTLQHYLTGELTLSLP